MSGYTHTYHQRTAALHRSQIRATAQHRQRVESAETQRPRDNRQLSAFLDMMHVAGLKCRPDVRGWRKLMNALAYGDIAPEAAFAAFRDSDAAELIKIDGIGRKTADNLLSGRGD